MRKIYRTEAFDEFFESLPDNVKEKVRYLLFMITEMKVVNTNVHCHPNLNSDCHRKLNS